MAEPIAPAETTTAPIVNIPHTTAPVEPAGTSEHVAHLEPAALSAPSSSSEATKVGETPPAAVHIQDGAVKADDKAAGAPTAETSTPVAEGSAIAPAAPSRDLPVAHHAVTAPATTGRLNRGANTTLGQMNKGRSTILGWKPDPEDLRLLRERRYMTGLFHLNNRLDVLDAGHYLGHDDPDKAEKPDPNLIVYSGPDDPMNPQNWPLWLKIAQTALLGVATTAVSTASAIFSTTTLTISERFHVSTEVSTLSTSMFLLGYALGPSIWGPASELFGRRRPTIISYLIFVVFQVPCAVGQNLETIFLGRFFSAVGASGTLAIVAGAYSDFWSPEARTAAIAIYGVAAAGGPALGPVLGNFIVQSKLEWRWTAYIETIWGGLMLILLIIFHKESYTPVILQVKAKRLRYETKNWAIRAKLDERQIGPSEIWHAYVSRPMVMFIKEPIVFAMCMYSAFVYGILYLLFGAVPYIFVDQRLESPGTGGLIFFSVFIGCLCAGGVTIFFAPRYNRKLHATGRIALPEERCFPMMIGACVFPIGFFLVGWTSVEYVSSPWPQIVGIGFVGCGFLLILLCCLNLLVDVYLPLANTAISANTVVRSAFAAGFPLFGVIMYRNLGTQWASTLLGCLALVFAPIPFVFYAYHKTLIAKSKMAPTFPPKKPQPPATEATEAPVDAPAEAPAEKA